jgi:cytochrome c-type biogenesis protein CcmE
MYGKKVKLRVLFLLLVLTSIILSVYLILKLLEKDVVYFLSPTDIKNLTEINNQKIRVGGMVKDKSIMINSSEINFIITDFRNEIKVSYSGAVPNLFEEGKGVVAEGFLKNLNNLDASKILAKHDENYMPPEVKKALGGK